MAHSKSIVNCTEAQTRSISERKRPALVQEFTLVKKSSDERSENIQL